MQSRFLFGDIVVVEDVLIGVVVKIWHTRYGYTYDVYTRSKDQIDEYHEDEIERYRVRHKELNQEELEYQKQVEPIL